MLHIHLALIKATTISALSLQLSRPITPVDSDLTNNSVLLNGPQAAANASSLTNSSGLLTGQWDGTIALPFNEPNISISYPSSNAPSHSENNIYISTFNTSAVSQPPKPASVLPPFPRDWQFECGEKLGTGMNPSSCLDAWTLLPPIEKLVSFGPRTAANTYDVGLPRRYLSSDGTCFIEPKLVSGFTEAYAKPTDAGIATAYVIRECVGDKAQGGGAQNSRGNGDLAVWVMKFVPRVVCSPEPYTHDPTVLKACQAIVDQMETSKGYEIFAQRDIYDRDLETPLPFIYTAPAEAPKCALRVTGRLPRQFGRWYTIWEAATAITAMCIRQGKGGRWEGLGAVNSITVTMGKVRIPTSLDEY